MDGGNKKQSSNREVTVGYRLFLYREEVRQNKVKASLKTKYKITKDLVVTTCNNIESYSKEERNHLIESLAYKKKLEHKIAKKSNKKKPAIVDK